MCLKSHLRKHIWTLLLFFVCLFVLFFRGGKNKKKQKSSDVFAEVTFFLGRRVHFWGGYLFIYRVILKMCWPAVDASNTSVNKARAQEWSHAHVKDPVVHVTVRWITEKRKDPESTLLTRG